MDSEGAVAEAAGFVAAYVARNTLRRRMSRP